MVNRKLKFLIPKDRGELVPMFLVIFLITVYVLFELCVILPTIYHNTFTYKEIFHLMFGFFIIYNLLGNLYSCLLTDTSVDTIICPFILPQPTVTTNAQDTVFYHCNWHYCHQCEVNVPPRSRHCHLCKKCVLKRDHHCAFFGRCIGFRNIRYYLCFLIWSWIGLFYCNILHMDYTYEVVGNLSWRFFVACLFPLGAWLFNLLDHFSLFISCLCSTSIIMSFYILFLIIQQIYLINRNQTWHEYLHDIRLYETGRSFSTKIKSVLGKSWLWVLLSPSISSSPIGDAMTFDMNSNERHNIGAKRS